MAYEYEGAIESILMNMVNREQHKSDIYYLMADEVKEVYAKARAFDEVIKIVETEFVSEDLADDIRILVNDYEYDMEDK